MKKTTVFFIAIIAALLVGCTSQQDPKGAVRAYFNSLQNEEFYNAAVLCLPTNGLNTDLQAAKLRKQYGKFILRYRILGVEQISEDKAIAVVRYKHVFSEAAGEVMELVDLTNIDGTWYIGKKADPMDFGWDDYDFDTATESEEEPPANSTDIMLNE
jgi:hypothetical protein